jgi:Domain of unknown function (DUF4440)
MLLVSLFADARTDRTGAGNSSLPAPTGPVTAQHARMDSPARKGGRIMSHPDQRPDGTEGAAVEGLRAAERRLQRAQLASDVAALDQLIDDRLVFTGPDGKHYTKQDDLRVHRSGHQSMTRVEEEDLNLLVSGDTGVTWFLGTREGTMAGQPFRARVRYTRTWIRHGTGWRLVAAHVSPADEDDR